MATPVLLNGFSNLKDVVNERVTENLIPVVTDAIDQSIAEHNKVTEDMLRLFVTPITDFKIRYKSQAAAKLQPLDEHGRARKIKTTGSYELGFPLRQAGTALGDTRIAIAKMTVGDVNAKIAAILDADKRWLRDGILGAMFDNAGYTFSDDEHGDLPVKGLANQDGTLYLLRSGAEDGAEANNYRFQSTLVTANSPLPTIHRDLTAAPENAGGGEVITFVASDLEDDIVALADFVDFEDADIRAASTREVLTGRLGVSVPGEVLGKSGKNWIVRWDSLPSSYMISMITAGPRPIAMRQHPEAELQGFNRVATRNDDPYYESQYVRYAGFGAWNRVGAIVTKIAASYAVPTNFEQPMV
jgi:hypothetical protein